MFSLSWLTLRAREEARVFPECPCGLTVALRWAGLSSFLTSAAETCLAGRSQPDNLLSAFLAGTLPLLILGVVRKMMNRCVLVCVRSRKASCNCD